MAGIDQPPGRCPRCSGNIPENSPGGVCPGCALEGALAGDATPETEFLSLADIPVPGDLVRYLGDYELLEVIGRGGMGVVYRARQRSLDRMVAVKMLLGGAHASDELKHRFRREAETAANLRHPGIVPIYEIGEHQGQAYFAMEYVAGEDLGKVVGHKPMPSEEAAAYAHELALIVQHAHEQGVLHRDLKPGNIMLGTDGRLRITDFGLAKQLESESGVTLSGEMLGSPSFMPPEQISTQRKAATPASDVYGLGAVLYFMLTGRPPFLSGSLKDTLEQVRSADPLPPSRLNPAVPRKLENICLRCLQKTPSRRYGTVAALAKELGDFRAGLSRNSRLEDWRASATLWLRQPLSLALLSIFLILSLSGFFAFNALNRKIETLKGHGAAGVQGESRGDAAPVAPASAAAKGSLPPAPNPGGENRAAKSTPAAAGVMPGVLLQQVYYKTPVPGIRALERSPLFPAYPDTVTAISSFEMNDWLPDRTAVRIVGRLRPPKTANYVFQLAAEDEAVLWLGADEKEAGKRVIAREPIQHEGTKIRKVRLWNSDSPNTSEPIALEAGRSYYIEVLMNHSSGTAYLGVHARFAEDQPPREGDPPISAGHLEFQPPADILSGDTQPVTAIEGERASLHIGLASPGWQPQWLRNGTPVSGETNLHLVTDRLRRGDNGVLYQCVLERAVDGRKAAGREVTVTVQADTEAPRLIGAAALKGSSEVFLRFSEPMELPADAVGGFSVPSRKVRSAELGPEARFVRLKLDGPLNEDFQVGFPPLKDFAGHTVNGPKQTTGRIAEFSAADIASRIQIRLPGVVIPCDADGFDVLAEGIGFGQPPGDDFFFVYREVSGDFEASVLLERLDCSSHLTVAGLMVREGLAGTASQLHAAIHPAEGANWVFAGALLEKEGNRSRVMFNGRPGPWSSASPSLMIRRKGNLFTFQVSAEGTNWETLQELEIPLAPKLLVGTATASHLFGGLAERGYASYRHFTVNTPGPTAKALPDGSATSTP